MRATIKNIIKMSLDRLRIRPMHFGVNLYDDIRRRLPNQRFSILFDVGANEGQTVKAFRNNFPSATIHCFEPNPECCRRLTNFGVAVHQMALGNEAGEIGFDQSQGQSDMFFVTHKPTAEKVAIDTIDNFCDQQRIKHIDFLKIDTEGYDLEVIRGSTSMLQTRAIDLVQAEVSMNAENTYHVAFGNVHSTLESSGYRLFGIYEQVAEWGRNVPIIRRSNVVYISPKVSAANPLH
jgi:FkbM family methyltransferase